MTKRSPVKVCRSVGQASDLVKTISNANRLAIVCYLMEQDCSVAQLEEDLGIEQPTLSQQLTYLREAGIIAGRRDAKNVIYSVSDHRIRPIILALRGIYAELEDVTMKRGRNGHASASMAIEESMFD